MVTEAIFLITMYGVGCDVKAGHPTKSGVQPVVGFTAAADPKVLPIGSIVEIEGFGERMVQDIGGKVKGNALDLFVADCKAANDWGKRPRKVRIKHVPKEKK